MTRAAIVLLVAMMAAGAVAVGVLTAYGQPGRESTAGLEYELTVASSAPIEVVGQLVAGEIPTPPLLGWCDTCGVDQKIAGLLAENWQQMPPYLRLNRQYGQYALDGLAALYPDAPVTPRGLLDATVGGKWLLYHFQRRIVACRGSDRPCIGRRQVAVGPDRNQYRCQYWVQTYEPAVDAILANLRQLNLLDEQGTCPPTPSHKLLDLPPYRDPEPDPGLYYDGGLRPDWVGVRQ